MTEVETRTRAPEETAAVKHVWPQGDDIDWPTLVDRDQLKVFVSGKDSTLYDIRGREYLDALSGLFVVNVGHGRSEIATAMAEQAARLAYTASSKVTNTAAVKLAETISALTPGSLDRIFFCSGGSEAVESALKIAKQTQVLRGFPKRYKIIGRRGSYHGTTYGAMGLTNTASEKYFGPFVYGFSKVASPNHYRMAFTEDPEESDAMCVHALEEEILSQGPENVAAFVAEPISASNGYHTPTQAYWSGVRATCDKHGVLLIMDEIITGYGRSGKWFASELYGVVPDILTMAKGLSSGYAPVAAVAVKDEVFTEFTEPEQPLHHLFTFGGQAVAAAAAQKNIEILQREELVARSERLGEQLLRLLQGLRAHPTVGDIRGGVGLMCGIELVRNRETKESWGMNHPFVQAVDFALQERGILTRVWNVLHLAPPLVITEQEMERLASAIDESLTECERQFAREIET